MDEMINKTEEIAEVKQLREELESAKTSSSYWYEKFSKLQRRYERHVNALQYVIDQMQEGN